MTEVLVMFVEGQIKKKIQSNDFGTMWIFCRGFRRKLAKL